MLGGTYIQDAEAMCVYKNTIINYQIKRESREDYIKIT